MRGGGVNTRAEDIIDSDREAECMGVCVRGRAAGTRMKREQCRSTNTLPGVSSEREVRAAGGMPCCSAHSPEGARLVEADREQVWRKASMSMVLTWFVASTVPPWKDHSPRLVPGVLWCYVYRARGVCTGAVASTAGLSNDCGTHVAEESCISDRTLLKNIILVIARYPEGPTASHAVCLRAEWCEQGGGEKNSVQRCSV
eukprot:910316-Rhodomonas_salina.3